MRAAERPRRRRKRFLAQQRGGAVGAEASGEPGSLPGVLH